MECKSKAWKRTKNQSVRTKPVVIAEELAMAFKTNSEVKYHLTR